MPCLLCSPGIVENLPALDRYECSPELAQQLLGSVYNWDKIVGVQPINGETIPL